MFICLDADVDLGTAVCSVQQQEISAGQRCRMISHRKQTGAYYTPDQVVQSLVQWAVHSAKDRLLDPSCGDGRFLEKHANSVGLERDPAAAATAIARAPSALVHEGEFFAWAASTNERFECAAGNPPFIRYQSFKGTDRKVALDLCSKLGADFSGLSSSWAPFLVATASLLKAGGRMAFVLPAEVGHAPYAAPLLEYLAAHFGTVQIIAVRNKLFPDLSEDCWLLYADEYGDQTSFFKFSALDSFKPSRRPPRQHVRVPVSSWRGDWNRRLRPFLMPTSTRDMYLGVSRDLRSLRLGDIARVGIGYVSGGNDFFHLKPSEAGRLGVPDDLLHVSVRNGRVLPERTLNGSTIKKWLRNDDECLLLKLDKQSELPTSIKRYLATDEAKRVKTGYKCRNRSPWYSVPDVQVPDFFLTYMSGWTPSLVRNLAGATCTNSVHSVRLHRKTDAAMLRKAWSTSFTELSCELEGHPLGGGMLKVEPREAANILIPASDRRGLVRHDVVEEGLELLRSWRHYNAN